MKRTIQYLAVAGTVALGVTVFAQSPDLNYDGNIDFLSLPAYGEVAGVATNSKGSIYVLARTGQPFATLGDERTFYHGGSRLFEFDRNGKYVKEVGGGTYAMTFASNVRVDSQDNVAVVDAGTNMVTKFDVNGQLIGVLGRKPEAINVRPGPGQIARRIDPLPAPPPPAAAGAAPAGGGGGGEGGGGGAPSAPGAGTASEGFSRPSDIAFDSAGNQYVADGNGGNNNRIAVFNKDSNWVTGWGSTGRGPGQFNRIKGIVLDAAGNVYVADSGNMRIQVFDSKGVFKAQYGGMGSPQALCITGGPTQYLYSSNSNDPESLDGGEIFKMSLDGKILGKFGKAGKLAKEFGMVNSLDCRTDGTLLVGEVWNWRVQKVTLKP